MMSSPKIIGCIISNNFSKRNGGGIYYDRSSNPIIVYNIIMHNNGGGIYTEKLLGVDNSLNSKNLIRNNKK